jgi:hypothetical protein
MIRAHRASCPDACTALATRSEKVRLGERRRNLAFDFPKQPPERLATLSFRAAVDDREGQEQVPVADRANQIGEPLLVAFPFRLRLPPEGVRLVVMLTHHEEIGVVRELGEEGPGQRCMAARIQDSDAVGRVGLERVVRMDEELQPSAIVLAEFRSQRFEIALQLGDVGPDRPLGMSGSRLAPVEVFEIARILDDRVERGLRVGQFRSSMPETDCPGFFRRTTRDAAMGFGFSAAASSTNPSADRRGGC